jgi:hypothetical protein
VTLLRLWRQFRVQVYFPYDWHRPALLWLVFGSGSGYLTRWWVALNRGPGRATKQGRPCGHRWPYHCHSTYCVSWWCGASRPGHPLRHLVTGHRFELRLPMWLSVRLRRLQAERCKER